MAKSRHKEVSAALGGATSLYQAAFFDTPHLAYILDKNCALVDCNRNLLTLLGLTVVKDKGVGALYKHMKQSGYWTEEQTQTFKSKDIEAILSAQAQRDQPELPVVDKQQGIHQFLSSRIPLFDSNQQVLGLLVVITEITERLKLQDQLEKMKAQLQHTNAQAIAEPHLAVDVPRSNAANSERTSPLKILVVEDNLIAQKATQAVLMQVDCLVDVVENEAKFMDAFVPGKYDLVFMDIGLEGTSGYVLAKAIRQQEKNTHHHVPIIALTGFKADSVKFDCEYYQMEGALSKPLTLEQAKQVLQHFVYHIDISVTGLKGVSQRI